MNAMPTLALVITGHHLTCYRREGAHWHPMALAGEPVATLGERAERQVEAIRDDLHDPASIAAAHLALLADDAAPARKHAARLAAAALDAGIGRIDIRRLAPLAERARLLAPGDPDQAPWCVEWLLPGLQQGGADGVAREDAGAAGLREQLQAAEQDRRELCERVAVLEGRCEQMRIAHGKELGALAARAAALEPPPPEASVRFMPLFFRHFWEKASPADMAHVLGMAALPAVPSPFPEPSGAALATMRRQFLAQPEPLRRAVLALARDLGVNWEIRPDMLDLFGEA